MGSNTTMTSLIVKLLITTCFIPISIKDEKIIWGFFTWKNIVHMFVYLGSSVAMMTGLHFVNDHPFSASSENPIETIATYVASVCDFQILCPLLISFKET